METRKENIEEIKKCIKECLHNDATIKFFGGRSSGRTYELIMAMSECLRELVETNEALVSNQKAMAETTDALLKRINVALKELEFGSVDKAKSILWDGLNGESDS